MKMVTTKAIAKVAAVATGLAMATSMFALAPMAHAALTPSQVQSILSLLSSFGADASTIANVNASLTGGTPVATTPSSSTSACSFTGDLTIGSTGAAVTCLQNALKAGGYMTANATGYFGGLTKAGVMAWQQSAGVTPAAGYFGAKSRAAFNLGGSVSTGPSTGPSTTPVTGNGLKVMLAPDSPNNVALVQGQAIGTLAKFTFSNPTGSEIKVTNLAFRRTGVSNDSTLANVYLYGGAKRLTDSASVSNSVFNFNDSTGVFAVPAGQTYTVSVLADIAGSTSGQQVGVQLTAVTSTGTLDSSVSFPVSGAAQTVSAATLATVDFNTTTLPSSSSVNPQNDYVVWQNTVTVGTRAVKLTSFQLRNIGSIKNSDISNLRLYVDGVQAGTAATLGGTDNTVTWDLSASPLTLQTGGRVIKVMGDIVGGSNSTFMLSLRRGSDAQMVDTDLNQPVLATANGSTFSARSATSATIAAGTVSSVKANNSPSSAVSLGATNVKFASFELRAAGEDVKIDNVDIQANTTLDRGLDNGKIFLNGVQVGSTKDLTDATDVNFTFGSSFILKAGTTAIVDIYADAKSTTGATFIDGETAAITLGTGSTNGTGQVSLTSINTPTSDVTANTITISSATATLTKYSGYGDTSMIAGTNNAKVGSFTLSTGSTEGMNVNTITVTLSADESATVTDLKLVDNATGAQLGTIKTSPSTSNSFSVNFAMGVSATKVIDIIANVKSGANIGSWTAAADGSATGASTGSSITFGSSSTALQTITLRSAVLTAATGVSPDNTIAIAGTSMVKIGSFDFTAQYSGYTIDKIKVKVPANAATAVSSITLKYPTTSDTGSAMTGSSLGTIVVSSGAQTYATSTFEGMTFYVPAGTTKKLDVYVNLSTIQNDADSGKAVSVALDYNEGFNAVDSSGTADTSLAAADLASTDTSGKGTVIVRKSIPTLSAVALDSSVLTNGSNKALARVKVTADAAGDLSWDKIAFKIQKTAAITLGATSTIALWNGSNQIAGNFATVTGDLLGGLEAFPVTGGSVSTTDLNLVFLPTAEQTVPAGTSLTYELRGTVGGNAAGASIDVAIANPTTSASTNTAASIGVTAVATPTFTWSDKSSVSAVHSTGSSDWTNDYLVKALPLTVGNVVSAL
jgi:hypothetical protein